MDFPRYMDGMDFGVLSDMPNIRKKACSKLFKQQVCLADLAFSFCLVQCAPCPI